MPSVTFPGVTFHAGGELGRYAVVCRYVGPVPVETEVSVFACSEDEAREAAVAKLRDNWLRHRGIPTQWTAHEAVLD